MTEESKRETARINVRGVVQGVGFRPFIYQLARKYALSGWVLNTSENVRIEITGDTPSIKNFIKAIPESAPPRATIEDISVSYHDPVEFINFEIRESIPEPGKYQLVSPDIATCPDCLSEIFDPCNRRFRYPFTNCTNCGPRFTIIEDIPYDRPLTTMKRFTMCPECGHEYEDPLDRRFHAQPNACPVCGPSLQLLDSAGKPVEAIDGITRSSELLKEGNILAIKGLGGFLLACDATSENAVQLLRERKHRPSKPFAVMLTSIEEVKRYCDINEQEETLLLSPGAPIVLVPWKPDTDICQAVAPDIRHLGVILPYTPLHYLLMKETGLPLVMTSGNLSEEPIAKDNDEAVRRLFGIADYFLVHNRDIHSRYDDSVMIVEDKVTQTVRRARGYAPYPVTLPSSGKMVLACGAELKNTFCVSRDEYAFVSQHIGDLENLETLEHYRTTIDLYQKLFRIRPEIVAHDLHPDYLSTRYALELKMNNPALEIVPIQHHHAHIASCMADNRLNSTVIGVALDGTGYGTDGIIWGSEFMTAGYHGFNRIAHLEYLPLAGGDLATRKPYRIAIGYLYSLLGESSIDTSLPFTDGVTEEELAIIKSQIDKKINSPVTSSCGRLFDAVSALLNVRTEVNYEAQAAIELEALAATASDDGITYPFSLDQSDKTTIIRLADLFSTILDDLHAGIPQATIALRFHNTVAEMVKVLCNVIKQETGLNDVVLSGGVFQNRLLQRKTRTQLESAGFTVFTHRQVPTNDGGISLGQAAIASVSGKQRGGLITCV